MNLYKLFILFIFRINKIIAFYIYAIGGGSFRVFFRRFHRIRKSLKSISIYNQVPPIPIRLQIETTNICNLNCVMCARRALNDLKNRKMSVEEFSKIVKEIDPFYVTMNGLGEPLLDETIVIKLNLLREKNIYSSMPTNGSFLFGDVAKALSENMPNKLQFSLDGATQDVFESIRIKGDFENIIKNICDFISYYKNNKTVSSSSMGIEFALQKYNLFQFKDMYTLYRKLALMDTFDLVPVYEYYSTGKIFTRLMPSEREVRILHQQLDEAIITSNLPEEKMFYKRWKNVSSQFIEKNGCRVLDPDHNRHACIVPWYNVYIDVNGNVFPCCFLITSNYIMGNIFEDAFDKIWTNNKYRDFRKKMTEDRPNLDGCRSCPRNDDLLIKNIRKYKYII